MRKKKIYFVYFEVLQNGEFLTETVKPLAKQSKVLLSSRKGALVLPFYPLSHDIELARIYKNRVHIVLESNWRGFCKSEGHSFEISESGTKEQILTIGPEDYLAIYKDDLSILVKVAPLKKEKLVPINKAYRGKWTKTFFEGQIESQSLVVAIFLTAILFSGILGGLMVRPDDQPRSRVDLDPKYNLAFIHPNHLKNLPEAVQKNLDRRKPISSAIKYFSSITEAFLGYDVTYSSYIFDNTKSLYKSIYHNQKKKIMNIIKKGNERSMEHSTIQNRALLAIPSVKGESTGGSILRLLAKLENLHTTFSENLKSRRLTTKEYNEDFGYNFEEYESKGIKNLSTSKISKIRVFELETNEALMYREAADLSLQAKIEQERINRFQEPFSPLSSNNIRPLGISPELNSVSISFNPFLLSDKKLDLIHGSFIEKKGKEQIKEPLVGKINPKLIERVINKNRFELKLCYELALRRNQNLQGQMEWTFRLDSNGKISHINLGKSTINDRTMSSCVRNKIVKWEWPRPKRGSIEITYPFVFSSHRG